MYSLGLDNSLIYNYLITAYIIHKKTDKALKWIKRLKKKQIGFNTTSYRKVLGLYCDMQDYGKAVDFILEQSSHTPTSYNMIKILKGSEKDPESFKDYLEIFESYHWDNELYQYLITYYSLQSDFRKAWLILEKYFVSINQKGVKFNVKVIYPLRDLLVIEKNHAYLQELFMICKKFGVDRKQFLKSKNLNSRMTSEDIIYLKDFIGQVEMFEMPVSVRHSKTMNIQ